MNGSRRGVIEVPRNTTAASGAQAPCRMNGSRRGVIEVPRKTTAASGAQAPCRLNGSRRGVIEVPRNTTTASGAQAPCRLNGSQRGVIEVPRKTTAASGAQAPCRMNGSLKGSYRSNSLFAKMARDEPGEQRITDSSRRLGRLGRCFGWSSSRECRLPWLGRQHIRQCRRPGVRLLRMRW